MLVLYTLRKACKHGRLGVAQWLVDRFSVTAEDARESGALLEACENDELDMAQWLADRFDMTAEDVEGFDAYKILMTADPTVVEWLEERFDWHDDRLDDDLRAAFRLRDRPSGRGVVARRQI